MFQIKKLSTISTEPQFLGIQSKFTNVLKFTNAQSYEPIPIYRILQPPGQNEDKNYLVQNYNNFYNFSIFKYL